MVVNCFRLLTYYRFFEVSTEKEQGKGYQQYLSFLDFQSVFKKFRSLPPQEGLPTLQDNDNNN